MLTNIDIEKIKKLIGCKKEVFLSPDRISDGDIVKGCYKFAISSDNNLFKNVGGTWELIDIGGSSFWAAGEGDSIINTNDGNVIINKNLVIEDLATGGADEMVIIDSFGLLSTAPIGSGSPNEQIITLTPIGFTNLNPSSAEPAILDCIIMSKIIGGITIYTIHFSIDPANGLATANSLLDCSIQFIPPSPILITEPTKIKGSGTGTKPNFPDIPLRFSSDGVKIEIMFIDLSDAGNRSFMGQVTFY